MTAHVSVYGRLGQEPRSITTSSGKPMTVCTLAVSIDVVKGDAPATQWFDITAFGKTAETLLRHKQGDPVAVMGRLQLRRWTDRDDQQRESWSVVADALVSARTVRPGGKKRSDQQTQGQRQQAAGQFQQPQVISDSEAGFNDELLF